MRGDHGSAALGFDDRVGPLPSLVTFTPRNLSLNSPSAQVRDHKEGCPKQPQEAEKSHATTTYFRAPVVSECACQTLDTYHTLPARRFALHASRPAKCLHRADRLTSRPTLDPAPRNRTKALPGQCIPIPRIQFRSPQFCVCLSICATPALLLQSSLPRSSSIKSIVSASSLPS